MTVSCLPNRTVPQHCREETCADNAREVSNLKTEFAAEMAELRALVAQQKVDHEAHLQTELQKQKALHDAELRTIADRLAAVEVAAGTNDQDIDTLRAKDQQHSSEIESNDNELTALQDTDRSHAQQIDSNFQSVNGVDQKTFYLHQQALRHEQAIGANRQGIGSAHERLAMTADELRGTDARHDEEIAAVRKMEGPQGAKGDTGDTGNAGARGADGAQGASGEDGAKGDTGAQGPQGLQGEAPLTPQPTARPTPQPTPQPTLSYSEKKGVGCKLQGHGYNHFEHYSSNVDIYNTEKHYTGWNFASGEHFQILHDPCGAKTFKGLEWYYSWCGGRRGASVYIDGSTHNGGWKQIGTGVMDASTCAAHMMSQVNIEGSYHFEKYDWWRLRWRSNTASHGPLIGWTKIYSD